nr:hypothetical protein [Tanacetum cinerariifolium]
DSDQQQSKRIEVVRAYATGAGNKKAYAESLPYCNKCKWQHVGPCTVKCGNSRRYGDSQLNDPETANETTKTNDENKRRFDSDPRDNRVKQPPLKRQNVTRAYTVRNNKNKGYAGILPLCDKCKLHHHDPCPVRCGNCEKVGHQVRDCWASTTITCYGCRGKEHTRGIA